MVWLVTLKAIKINHNQKFVPIRYANWFRKHNNEHNVQGAMLWRQKIKSIFINAGMALADKMHKQVHWLMK